MVEPAANPTGARLSPLMLVAALGIGVVLFALALTLSRLKRAAAAGASGSEDWIDRLETGPALDRGQRRRLRRLLQRHSSSGGSDRADIAEPASAESASLAEPKLPNTSAAPPPEARYRFKEEIPTGPGVFAAEPGRVESETDFGFDTGALGDLGASVIQGTPGRSFFGLTGSHRAQPAGLNFGEPQ